VKKRKPLVRRITFHLKFKPDMAQTPVRSITASANLFVLMVKTSTYIECGTSIVIFLVSQSQQGCAKHAHYSQTPLLKCNKYKLGHKFVHMYASICTNHFQEIILPVTRFITYMKVVTCGRIIIREPKMDFTGLPSTIPDHSSHGNPEM